MTWTWLGFAVGILLGVVVTWGLAAGMRILADLAGDPEQPAPLRRRKIALASLYLAGQLVVAVLSFVLIGREHLFGVGVGLVLCVLMLSVITSFKL